jgi:hypothetical protein
MFSLNKFLVVGSDDRNIYIKSDDGNKTHIISTFNETLAFVSNNLLKIKKKGTDDIIIVPFSSNSEALLALKKFQDQLDILRRRRPFILDKDVKNYIDGFTGITAIGSGFQGTQGVTGPAGGPQGADGPIGPTGPFGGPQGIVGPIGPTGPAGGPQGFQGIQGGTISDS